ncbi:Mon2 dimerization and cyclophilin-binding domain [Trinorchestia longiramus]|nr:Mon2 dimerization and cyclophilin-binding domain [Trinorchestia longiramus]
MTAGGGKSSGGQGHGSNGTAAVKLLEGLQTDLRNLCLQIRKKYPHIKESCEDATMQLRSTAASCSSNSSSSSSSPSAVLAPIAPHVLHPLLQAAHTKDPKIVQMALGVVQRVVVAGGVVESACGGQVVEALWLLMEAGVEELKVLQTITLLVTTNDAITGEHLAMDEGRPRILDSDQLNVLVFENTTVTTREIARPLDVVHTTGVRQLKHCGKLLENGFLTSCLQKIDCNGLLVVNHCFCDSFKKYFWIGLLQVMKSGFFTIMSSVVVLGSVEEDGQFNNRKLDFI